MKLKFLVPLLIMGVLLTAFAACNVTRTITTTSQHVKRGDTTLIIQTKTIESYDARKNSIN